MLGNTLALRLALAMIVCVGLTAAGDLSTCPYSATDVYDTKAPCAMWTTCMSSYCSCLGTTLNADTGYCTATSGSTCSSVQNCTTPLMPCLNKAAADSSCNVTALTTLRLELVTLANGQFYNGSDLETQCRLHTCKLTNNSVSVSSGCNLTSIGVASCVAPYVYNGVLTLSGDWTAILANATAKAATSAAIGSDLTKKLQAPVTVTSLSAGSLIVQFTASVSGTNPALQSNIASAASTSNWLAGTQAAYASSGGSGTLGVTGLSAATTLPPTTPTPPTTTPTPTPTPGSAAGLMTLAATVISAAVLLL